MLLFKIVLGLIGLGIVVFVHELGHFLAARLAGIDVEAFSIGWGKPLLKRKVGNVEYRLGMFPIGGYCKMRGENEFREAWENRQKEVEPIKGTFFGANPFRRILVCFAGPFFNLLFAVLMLSIVWGAGMEVHTLGNRIILASDIRGEDLYPADAAGLKSGDRIVAIDGKETPYYHNIQEMVAINPEKNLNLTVERDGSILEIPVRPSLEKSTGAGRIGVYFWNEPVIEEVAPGSAASAAGLEKGDRILTANGETVRNSMDMYRTLETKPDLLELVFERNGNEKKTNLVPVYTDQGEADLGIGFAFIEYKTPALPFHQALFKGVKEAWKTLTLYLRSLGLLFRGIDLTKAVSGPVRITYMVGDIAAEGFGESISAGLRSMINFLSLISVALCIMNLLPLPILDGGMILLFIFEAFLHKPLHPKLVGVFQTVGVVLIFSLMAFALFGDILFLSNR
ncbi:MAG: site-2 protease family protein [Treponema sp.]|jgi:regulator of sigma E protease|nr:site-2 protease family protein [Treponema sp.]